MTEGKLLHLPVTVDREDFPLDRVELQGLRWKYPRSSHVRLTVEFLSDSFMRYMVWVGILSDNVRDDDGDRREARVRLDKTFLTPQSILQGVQMLKDLGFSVEGCKSLRVSYVELVRAYLRKFGYLKIGTFFRPTEIAFIFRLPEGVAGGEESLDSWSEWIIRK